MSGIKPINLPKWGMNMQEGKLVEWLAEEGEEISEGDEIIEIESEKIVNVMEASISGKLRRQCGQIGETYPVGQLLAVVADDDVSDAEIDAFIKDHEASFAKVLQEREAAGTGPTIATVGGRAIEYAAAGDGQPATVFIHGIGGQKEAWLISQNAAAELGQTVAIDLPGHGGSAKSVEVGDLDELAGYVLGVMDELGIGSAHLVGHSLGAVIASHIARHHPDRAKSAFLIAAAGPGTIVSPAFIEAFGKAESRGEVKKAMMPLFVDKSMVTRDLVQAVLKTKRIEGANACLQKIGEASGTQLSGLDPMETLRAIKTPVSIVWGAEDEVCSLENTKGLPDSVKLTVFDGAGHMVQIEKMAEVNDLLLDHIRAAD